MYTVNLYYYSITHTLISLQPISSPRPPKPLSSSPSPIYILSSLSNLYPLLPLQPISSPPSPTYILSSASPIYILSSLSNLYPILSSICISPGSCSTPLYMNGLYTISSVSNKANTILSMLTILLMTQDGESKSM